MAMDFGIGIGIGTVKWHLTFDIQSHPNGIADLDVYICTCAFLCTFA